jgi:hypothetical protein
MEKWHVGNYDLHLAKRRVLLTAREMFPLASSNGTVNDSCTHVKHKQKLGMARVSGQHHEHSSLPNRILEKIPRIQN